MEKILLYLIQIISILPYFFSVQVEEPALVSLSCFQIQRGNPNKLKPLVRQIPRCLINCEIWLLMFCFFLYPINSSDISHIPFKIFMSEVRCRNKLSLVQLCPAHFPQQHAHTILSLKRFYIFNVNSHVSCLSFNTSNTVNIIILC